MKRPSTLSRAAIARIAANAAVPVAAATAHINRTKVPSAPAVTAGRQSRMAVFAALAFSYQDSGLTEHLMGGNLDAPESAPAGSHVSRYQIAGTHRNSVTPQLAAREFGLTYTITERTAAGQRSYTAIGDVGTLQDAAYERGALGVTAMVRR